MGTRRAALVHLGSSHAMGLRPRVASWTSILRAAGAEVVDVPLLRDHRSRLSLPSLSGARAVAAGRTVPETAVWSLASLRRRLDRDTPDVVVCVTTRAWRPELADGPWTVVLDFVDRLSTSYRQRASRTAPPIAAGYRVLAWAAARVERRPTPGVRRVAAGWADGVALDADWVPNVVQVAPPAAAGAADGADHDVLFFGTLDYAPNVAAIERLARVWPRVRERRPGTTALLAGARANTEVRRLAAAHGWDLMAGFDDLEALCRRARVAVAPLPFASGIQNKVLEAAAHGLAQVTSPAAVAGLEPGFPAVVEDGEDEFAAAVVGLLDDDGRRQALAEEARAHVAARYTADAWAGWARALWDHQ